MTHQNHTDFRKPPFREDRNKMKELVYAGWSDTQIAKHFNANPDTIALRRRVWDLPTAVGVKSQKRIERIKEMLEAGKNIEDIMGELHLSRTAVYSYIRRGDLQQKSILPELNHLALSDIPSAITTGKVDHNNAVVVTLRTKPTWVMVPLEQFKELSNAKCNATNQPVSASAG